MSLALLNVDRIYNDVITLRKGSSYMFVGYFLVLCYKDLCGFHTLQDQTLVVPRTFPIR